MNAQDVIGLAQQWAGEQNVGQRWTPQQWLSAVDIAHKNAVRDLKWPPSWFLFTSTPMVQQYQLQEVVKIIQVYVNGQICPKTDLETLEGQQLLVDDQSGTVGGPSGLVSPNNAPAIAGGNYTPAWSSQPAQTYPVANGYGMTLAAMPWFPGQRPMHFRNGGNLGLVPAPATAVPILCRVVRQPVTLQKNTDALVLPSLCQALLAWDAVEQFYFFDRDQSGAADNRNYAASKKGDEMTKAIAWRRDLEGGTNDGPMPRTARTDTRGRGQRRVS